MKIAYIAPTGIYGGVRIVAEHLNRLQERGHDCTLISVNNQPLTWLYTRFEQRPISDPGAGYDIVVGTAIPTWQTALGVAKGARTFGLLQMADWAFEQKGSQAQREIIEQFAAPVEVLAISEWLAKLAETIEGRPVHRIRNGIDPRLFYHEKFPDLPPHDGVTVVTEGYGRNPAKDVECYFQRAVRLARFDAGLNVRAIGFSQFPPEFEFDAYWQTPEQELIKRIYSSGDIFLKASRLEGRPGPDMEAMACGAVVCRAIGAGDDDLIHGENCLKVGYGDFDGFYQNFLTLCSDAELREKLRANAYQYVKDKYHWDGAIDLVEQALTGSISVQDPRKDWDYDLSAYNALQAEIVGWETPQAMWLGETLADMLNPKSVIDIGCGPGIYLTPFKPKARVLGVDGAPDAGQALEPSEFVTADFRNDWQAPDSFCLSLCIETAEHLPPTRADYLIDLLTTCSDVCFFSAAQPGQGGHLHLNEQPRDYWVEKFKARGFDLHPLNDKLAALIAANPHCQRVRWLIGNSFLVGRVNA